jgi:hypothetical protein
MREKMPMPTREQALPGRGEPLAVSGKHFAVSLGDLRALR